MCRRWNLLRRVTAFLTIYYLLNLGIPAGSPRYFGGQAFTMGCGVSLVVTANKISPDFKDYWVFPWCYLAAMMMSLVSLPLHFVAPEFIEWYIGPALTGLWGGFYCILAFSHNRTRNTTLSNIPNNGMDPSPQESQTSR